MMVTKNKNEVKFSESINLGINHFVDLRRKQVARDIHDEIGNNIAAIRMNLNIAQHYLNTSHQEAINAHIQICLKVCDEATVSVKRIVNGLRPAILEEYGLMDSFIWLVNDFTFKFKEYTFSLIIESNKTQLKEALSYLNELEIFNLFRVAQESMTNCVKYSKGKNINLTLKLNKNNTQLVMEIADDGIGFNQKKEEPGYGVIFMHERISMINGKLKFLNVKGAKVKVTLPLRSHQ